MMTRLLVHPTATILGVPVVTDDGDFVDLAHCDSPLGHIYLSRYGSGWGWGLLVDRKADDDFSSLDSDTHSTTLEEAAQEADRHLNMVANLVNESLLAELRLHKNAARELRDERDYVHEALDVALGHDHEDDPAPAKVERLVRRLTSAEEFIDAIAQSLGCEDDSGSIPNEIAKLRSPVAPKDNFWNARAQKIIDGLVILQAYEGNYVAAEHDTIYAGSEDGTSEVSLEHRNKLIALEWHWDAEVKSWAIYT